MDKQRYRYKPTGPLLLALKLRAESISATVQFSSQDVANTL
jgi:hypothetical protein